MTETTPSLTKIPDIDLRTAIRDPFVIVPQVLDLVRLNGAIFSGLSFGRHGHTPHHRSSSWPGRCRTLRAAWSCSTSSPRATAGSPSRMGRSST